MELQQKNVFCKIDGAANLNNFCDFKGTVICNNGAVSINKGSKISGRVLTTNGSLATDSINTTILSACATVGINDVTIKNENNIVSFFPNPMKDVVTVVINNGSDFTNCELRIYNTSGALVITKTITEQTSTVEKNLPTGLYFYKLVSKNTIQTGKLISQ